MGITVRPYISREEILRQVSEYQIFKRYCVNFIEVGIMFKSEFREDKQSSCCIAFIRGHLLYTDFGEGTYNCWGFVRRKFNLNYDEALLKIKNDFNLQGLNNTELNSTENNIKLFTEKIVEPTFVEKVRSTILIKQREWTIKDVNYWSQYQIPTNLLEEYSVKSISHYWVINQKGERMYTNNTIGFSYDYYWNEGIFLRKLYFPLNNKEFKWISNVDFTVVQGWDNLPKEGGEILFITKSFKDILIFKLLGYWAVAPNNENAFIPEKVFEKLKSRWKRIIIWYDNDTTGIVKGKEFSEKYKIEYYYNPIESPKDPSDFVKATNLQAFNELVNNIIYGSRE